MQNQEQERNTIKAVVFDMDGVITDTANLHKQAWKQTFDLFLRSFQQAEQTTGNNLDESKLREFTYQDYYDFVDGKPRMQGIQSFLKSRNIDLPMQSSGGNSGTSSQQLDSVEQIAEAKNKRFLQLLEEDGAPVYDSTIQLIYKLKRANIPVAVASSSKNCRLVLSYTDLLQTKDDNRTNNNSNSSSHYLAAILDGNDLDTMRLQGKPHPDMFLKAVELIDSHLDARQCVVFEDATSGVEAGKNGKFGLVVGVDRVGQAKQLYEHGAHVVVKDLAEIASVDALNKLFQRASSGSSIA